MASSKAKKEQLPVILLRQVRPHLPDISTWGKEVVAIAHGEGGGGEEWDGPPSWVASGIKFTLAS